MDFSLTSEQRDMFDTMRAFAMSDVAPHALDWDQNKTFPADTLRQLAQLGMGGIYIPEAQGGTGLSRVDAVLLFEALSYGCPTLSSFVSIENLTTGMVAKHGTKAVQDKWLARMISMEAFGSYCLTEPGAGSDAAALATTARREGDHYILNGSKSFISGGGVADVNVVMCRTGGPGPEGISAIVVEKGAQGLSYGAQERKMGWNCQPTAQVMFADCSVPVSNLLGEEGKGFSYAMAGLDTGRLNISASSLGGAQAAMDKTLAYMQERKAFGQQLDQFQALQFRLADMETKLQASRALLRQAAWKLDAGAADATTFCAMAKKFVTDSCFEVANDCLQLHGGYGYLHDYGIEKIMRDLRVHQILEGSNEIMRLIISRSLVEKR